VDCPVCNLPLIILELHEIEIDYCTNCHGIWLDEGELEILLNDANGKEELFNSFSIEMNVDEKKIKCPVCFKKMLKVSCGNNEKIILDECPNKHGLWFNRGELQSVIELGSLDKQNKIVHLLKDMFAHNLS